MLRASPEVGNLRRRCVYLAIQQATEITSQREGFRLVHVSIQRTHLHLIVEADNKLELVKGMQGFQVSAARRINAAIRPHGAARRGAVFPDRYHATEITTPRQARHVLAYVMLNWRRHQEDRHEKTRDWKIDWFSSAVMFPDWAEYGDEHFLWRGPPTYEPLLVFRPRTWLLREGWKKHSPTISRDEVPASRTNPSR